MIAPFVQQDCNITEDHIGSEVALGRMEKESARRGKCEGQA